MVGKPKNVLEGPFIQANRLARIQKPPSPVESETENRANNYRVGFPEDKKPSCMMSAKIFQRKHEFSDRVSFSCEKTSPLPKQLLTELIKKILQK